MISAETFDAIHVGLPRIGWRCCRQNHRPAGLRALTRRPTLRNHEIPPANPAPGMQNSGPPEVAPKAMPRPFARRGCASFATRSEFADRIGFFVESMVQPTDGKRKQDRAACARIARPVQQGKPSAAMIVFTRQSRMMACGEANSRSWNLPLLLKSQSSISSRWPRALSRRGGGSGKGDARRSVARAVRSASSSPFVR
jgi:hypothetical protein